MSRIWRWWRWASESLQAVVDARQGKSWTQRRVNNASAIRLGDVGKDTISVSWMKMALMDSDPSWTQWVQRQHSVSWGDSDAFVPKFCRWFSSRFGASVSLLTMDTRNSLVEWGQDSRGAAALHVGAGHCITGASRSISPGQKQEHHQTWELWLLIRFFWKQVSEFSATRFSVDLPFLHVFTRSGTGGDQLCLALLCSDTSWWCLKMDEDGADGFGHRNRHQMSSEIAKVLCVEIATTCPGRSSRMSRQLMRRQISPNDNFTLINLEVEAKNMRVAGCCSCSFYIHAPIYASSRFLNNLAEVMLGLLQLRICLLYDYISLLKIQTLSLREDDAAGFGNS